MLSKKAWNDFKKAIKEYYKETRIIGDFLANNDYSFNITKIHTGLCYEIYNIGYIVLNDTTEKIFFIEGCEN